MSIQNQKETASSIWSFVECCEDGLQGRAFTLRPGRSSIGRTSQSTICIRSASISKSHAHVQIDEGRIILEDNASTNGTFVNGKRITSVELQENDLVQFAETLFRLHRSGTEEMNATADGGPNEFAMALLDFDELMSSRALRPHYQPIVNMADAEVCAYELLARSDLEALRSPYAMFSTAAKLGQEANLSELMRTIGVEATALLPTCPNLFVNTHPKEILNERFLKSLETLRKESQNLQITVEVHEAALTDLNSMRELRQHLDQHQMLLAYDDFGAGQARLDELAEVPPDYLKFDIKLVRGLDQAPERRRRLIESLVKAVHDLGVQSLAEGIETIEEAAACKQIGFQLAQGYYYGKPLSADTWAANPYCRPSRRANNADADDQA